MGLLLMKGEAACFLSQDGFTQGACALSLNGLGETEGLRRGERKATAAPQSLRGRPGPEPVGQAGGDGEGAGPAWTRRRGRSGPGDSQLVRWC